MLCHAADRQHFHTVISFTRYAAIMILLLLLAACRNADSAVGETPVPDGPDDGVTIAQPNGSTLQITDNETENRQIVIWAPEFWAPADETPAGQVVNSAITQFEQANAGVKVEVQTKAEGGETSILNYLRSAQKVAPAILPDAVFLDTQDLWRLVELGMAQPFSDTMTLQPQQFYPFTAAAVQVGDGLYGIPYATDIVHAASSESAEQPLPRSWSTLAEDGWRYLFPAAGSDGGRSLLLQYIGAGGSLAGEDLAGDEETLNRLFTFYAGGIEDGLIPPETANLSSVEAAWSFRNADASDVVDMTVSALLQQGESLDNIVFSHAPTSEGQPVSVARTWAFVVLTSDPGQQEQVLELIQVLLDPDVQGEWSQFANLLPTTPAAATTWNRNQPYYDFIFSLLENNTYAVPNGRPFTESLRRIQMAQQDVLAGRLTPAEAVTIVRSTP